MREIFGMLVMPKFRREKDVFAFEIRSQFIVRRFRCHAALEIAENVYVQLQKTLEA